MVEDGAMERLAERLVLGKLGPIGHTIRLTDGTSWDKILRDNNMSLTLRDKLRRDAEDVVQRAVEMFEMWPVGRRGRPRPSSREERAYEA